MRIVVTLVYECEGTKSTAIQSLVDSYRPRQGRVESFSTGEFIEGSFISTHGKCVAFSVKEESK